LSGDNPSEGESQDIDPTSSQVFIISQDFVSSALKSPSTAKFPVTDYQFYDLGDHVYGIVSYVDSQNGFGAVVRSSYSTTTVFSGGQWANPNNWTLKKLSVDGEIIYEEQSSDSEELIDSDNLEPLVE